MKKRLLVVIAIMLCLTSSFGFAACSDKNEDVKIIISGSTSVTPLMEELASKYEETHSGIKIQITPNDSGTGVQDTITGKNEIGMASRSLKSTETGVKSYKIADDGVVMIVNNSVELTNVTSQEIYDLYANGVAIGALTGAISRENGSGTRDAFDGLIKDGDGNKLSALTSFASCVDVQNSTGYVMTEIAANSTKIGYISLGSLNNTVKGLSYNGVEPTVENIKNLSYKLCRPFNIIVKDGVDLSAEAQAFVNFILGSEGQAIVESKGYVSIA